MQIVIKMPDTDTTDDIIRSGQWENGSLFDIALRDALKNCIVLPKGHGRLIDEKEISLSGIHFETELDHARMIGRLNTAKTIIEAEKGAEK